MTRHKYFWIIAACAAIAVIAVIWAALANVKISGPITTNSNIAGIEQASTPPSGGQPAQQDVSPSPGEQSAQQEDASSNQPIPTPLESAPPMPAASSGFDDLKSQIEQKLANKDGDWSICIVDLTTGTSLEINNKKMVSASLTKLFIMAKTFEDMHSGKLKATDEVRRLLSNMITVSHNQSSNDLVSLIGGGDFEKGMGLVNSYTADKGYLLTEQQRDMRDYREIPIPQQNYTSAGDCAKLLIRIYSGECVSKQSDSQMLDLLLAQSRRTKIPAGLPKGTKVGNKTGELSQVENDAAIVFSPGGDYVLCVISNQLSNTEAARGMIVDLSKLVYGYFN